MSEAKLPKQWRKWVQKAGLRTAYDSKLDRHSSYGGDHYLKGHGRHWRVDCEGYLDVSEPFETFDRWANSLVRSVPMTAKTEREFLDLVVGMLPIDKRRAFRERHGMYSAMTMHILKARTGGHGHMTFNLEAMLSIDPEPSAQPEPVGAICYDDSVLTIVSEGVSPGATLEVFAGGVGVGHSILARED